MASFTHWVPRLLRVDWNRMGPQALAQELAACFNSDEPITITSPVTIGPTGDDPPLTLVTNTQPNGTTPEPLVININQAPVSPPGPAPPPAPPPPVPPPPVGGGGMFSARVDSQASGVNYNCTLYPGGFSAVVEMKNLSVLSPATDLVGVWVPAVLVATNTYHGFPSVLYGS